MHSKKTVKRICPIKAVLFDIDGTIMNCHRAGKIALLKAAEEVFGTAGNMENVNFQGKTDPFILYESLSSAGFNKTEIAEKTGILKEKYIARLNNIIFSHKATLMPGIKELLLMLENSDNILTGLLTGNFRESAAIKLSRFNLNRHFSFGVFGCDTANRNDMPLIAKKIIDKKYSIDLDFGDMIIIGDTVYDILCSKHAGAVSISVGTGWTHKEVLLNHKPDFYFDDLSNTDAVVDLIINN